MTIEEAQKTLTLAREGQPIPPELVAEAVAITEDKGLPCDPADPDLAEFVQALRDGGVL